MWSKEGCIKAGWTEKSNTALYHVDKEDDLILHSLLPHSQLQSYATKFCICIGWGIGEEKVILSIAWEWQ
jgi:hypothetical protein